MKQEQLNAKNTEPEAMPGTSLYSSHLPHPWNFFHNKRTKNKVVISQRKGDLQLTMDLSGLLEHNYIAFKTYFGTTYSFY